MRFLTEPEVAEILRCSTSKVKRLRLSGRLAYLPGRPVLVAPEEALGAYVSAATRAAGEGRTAEPAAAPSPEAPARERARKNSLLRARGRP